MLGADSRMDLCANAYQRGDGRGATFDHAGVRELEDRALASLTDQLLASPGKQSPRRGFGDFVKTYRRRFSLYAPALAENVTAYSAGSGPGGLILFPHDERAREGLAEQGLAEGFISSHYVHDHACTWCLLGPNKLET